MKILDLLNNKTKWAKKHLALDADGYSVGVCSSTAVRWCLLGAITKCYETAPDRLQAIFLLSAALPKQYQTRCSYEDIISFNDRPATTFRRVRALLKKSNV